MHLLIHLLFNLLISFTFELSSTNIWIVVLSGILIDLDHLIYVFFIAKKVRFKQIMQWYRREYSSHNPHLYIFHSLEFIIVIFLLGLLVNNFFIYVGIGLIFHLVLDWVAYLFYYKSFKPWFKYFFLFTKKNSN